MFNWAKAEKRKQHRTEAGAPKPFKLSLLLPGRIQLPGHMVEISMDGAVISFPAEKYPDFDLNERVKLILIVVETQKIVLIDAILRGSRSAKDRNLSRFQFVDPSRFVHELDISVLSYFNRRQAFRVKPSVSESTKVALAWEGGSAVGWIIDISITGMGLGVPSIVAQTLGNPDQLELSFKLSGCEESLKLIGNAVNRRPAGKIVKYGIHFDPSQTEDFHRQQDVISRYVMRQQKKSAAEKETDKKIPGYHRDPEERKAQPQRG